jgi:hypothetical protein
MNPTMLGMLLLKCRVFYLDCFILANNDAYKVTAAIYLSKIFQFLSPEIDEHVVIVADRDYQWFQHEVLKEEWVIK